MMTVVMTVMVVLMTWSEKAILDFQNLPKWWKVDKSQPNLVKLSYNSGVTFRGGRGGRILDYRKSCLCDI